MECMFLFVLILALSGKFVQAKTFTCVDWYTNKFTCEISDVGPQDSIEVAIPYVSPQITNYFPQDSYSLSSQTATSWTFGLTISNSSMDDIPPISLNNSAQLYFLNCVGCKLTDISERAFASLPLNDLVELDISSGSFLKLKKNLFIHLASLHILTARNGAVSEVDSDAFFNLTNLKSLDLSYNNITEITSTMLAPLANMYHINLSHNHIRLLGKDLFFNNTKLSYLYLQHNDISKIDDRIFNPQSIVYYLHLHHNELTTLDTHMAEPAINILADHNRIKQLSISSTIKGLNVGHNDIENVSCDEGSIVSFLDLTNNSLTELGCIGSLTQLMDLSISYNNLGKLNQSTFAALTELTKLSLKSVNTGKLEYGIFSHQNKLQNLDISYNHVGNFVLEMLLATRHLEALYIDGNNLTEFSFNDLKTAFIRFHTISIGDNDFNCTFLSEAIKQTNSKNIRVVAYSRHLAANSKSINGIGCDDKKVTVTPPSDVIKTFKELSEDSAAIKQQILKMNSDILSIKAEVLQLSSLQSNSSSTTKINSNSDLIENVNVILIALIVAFCVYKAYKMLKNDVPCMSRDKTNTLYTNIETGNTCGK